MPRKNWQFCPEVEVGGAVKEACHLGTDCFGEARAGFQSCSSFCKEVDEKMDEKIKQRLESYLELLEQIGEKTQNAEVIVPLFQKSLKTSGWKE